MKMVSNCCVKGCTNKSNVTKKNSPGIAFHVFPSKPEIRKKWLRAINRPYWDPPSYARVCSEHFNADQLNHDGNRIRIVEDACPVNALPLANSFSTYDLKVCRICLATDNKLFSLEYGILKVCMEAISEMNDKQDMLDLPQFVCYECGAQLIKYYRLIEKSLIAQATLLDIFADNGRITKHLVRQKNRKDLNLQSSLGYCQPADVIELTNYGDKDGILEFNDNSNEPEIHECQDEFEEIVQNDNSNKNKPTINRSNKKFGSNSNKSDLKQLDPDSKEITLNEDAYEQQMCVDLKSEVIDIDSDNIDVGIDKPKFKTEDIDEIKPLIKIVHPVTKYENLDSCTDDLAETSKGRRQNTSKLKKDNKPRTKRKNIEYCSVGKVNSEDITEVFGSLNDVLKNIEESDHNSEDGMVNAGDLSDGDSSDDEFLQSLKNKAKLSKNTQDKKVINKKANTKLNALVKKEVRAIQQAGQLATPVDSAIAKLKCFTVTHLSLKEQIETWNTENEQPPQHSQFECAVCTKKFVRKKAYEMHLPRHDPSRGGFQCPVCKERFRNLTRFCAHTTRNHAKRYDCLECSKVFHNLDKAQRHETFHSGQEYACPHCAYRTTRRSTAWEHVRTQHAHAHHCAVCGHTFINAKGLGTHAAMAHPGQDGEPKDPYPCEECNIVFHSEGALRVHRLVSKQHKDQKAAPGDPPPKPTCKRCGAVFSRLRELWAHTQQKHKKYASGRGVRVRGHDAEPYPMPCDHCNIEIKSRFEHWCHVRREHPEHKHLYRSIVTAICATCGKGFRSKTMLTRHEQKHRGPATLQCSACPRAFHDAYSLRKHERAHEAERPHACDECGKAFKVKGNLERHRRMHTGETPYECKYCGKKFRYWESLTLHERHMHQKVPWPARDRSARARRATRAGDDD